MQNASQGSAFSEKVKSFSSEGISTDTSCGRKKTKAVTTRPRELAIAVRRTARSLAKTARSLRPSLGVSCSSKRNGHAKINIIRKPATARKNHRSIQGSQKDRIILSVLRIYVSGLPGFASWIFGFVFAQKRGLRRGRSDRSPGNTHPGVVSGSERVGGKCLDAGVPKNRPHIGAAHDSKRFGQRRLLAAGCLGKLGNCGLHMFG